jgi:hypothetical protein
MMTDLYPTPCDRMVGPLNARHRCRRPVRYVFTGMAGYKRDLPMRRAFCVQHSGPGYLSEGALPGWVDSVIDLHAETA